MRDLDAAGAFYGRAGFTVGSRNRHPWGTHNRIVQLKNCYIEILEIAEPDKIVPHGPRFFSFGAFSRVFLARGEGFSMLLLNSRNASEDARSFEAGGIGGFDVFEFAREGKRPDGSEVKLAFSLAFAADPSSPDVRFASCQHHFPENFWNPAFQLHANGAQCVAGVTMVARNPDRHADFLRVYTGERRVEADGNGIVAHTENGEIGILTPPATYDRFGISAKAAGEGIELRGLRFQVGNFGAAEASFHDNHIAFQRHAGRLVVPQEVAFGATLIFEAAKDS